jgi:hypothetical protein
MPGFLPVVPYSPTVTTEGIPLWTIKERELPYLFKQPPFGKRESFWTICERPDNFGISKIRGIQRKRYNEEIFLCVTGPDGNFFVVKKNPG